MLVLAAVGSLMTKALAGVSYRKVGHPTAKHWIDQLNDPIQGLRLPGIMLDGH
jgi:hypothetical protein